MCWSVLAATGARRPAARGMGGGGQAVSGDAALGRRGRAEQEGRSRRVGPTGGNRRAGVPSQPVRVKSLTGVSEQQLLLVAGEVTYGRVDKPCGL